MKHRVPFIVAELGSDTDPFLLHIYAALAEKERISSRGGPRMRSQLPRCAASTLVGCATRVLSSKLKPGSVPRRCVRCSPSLPACHIGPRPRRSTGAASKTATGKAWTAVQVIRVRERLADRQ